MFGHRLRATAQRSVDRAHARLGHARRRWRLSQIWASSRAVAFILDNTRGCAPFVLVRRALSNWGETAHACRPRTPLRRDLRDFATEGSGPGVAPLTGMHGNTAYVIEPADGLEDSVILLEDPVILLYKQPRLAAGSQAPVMSDFDDGLDCSTIQAWPPPSRPPAVMGWSDGVPTELMS